MSSGDDAKSSDAAILSHLFAARGQGRSSKVFARVLNLLSKDRSKHHADSDRYPAPTTKADRKKYFTKTVIEHLASADIECPYCDIEITAANFSLDRVKNNESHTSGNCIITCFPCNLARNDFYTVHEFRTLMQLLKQMKDSPDERAYQVTARDSDDLPQTLASRVDELSIEPESRKELARTRLYLRTLDHIYAQFNASDIQDVEALLSHTNNSDSIEALIDEAMDKHAIHPDRPLEVDDDLLSELINNLTEELNRFSD